MVTTAERSRRTAWRTQQSRQARSRPADAQPATKTKSKKAAAKGGKPAKRANAVKKLAKVVKPAAKKAAAKSATERTNKKAEVIALMSRAKGATLDEIVTATGWQKHTVRGFVSILGKKGGETIESAKNAAGERTYKITK